MASPSGSSPSAEGGPSGVAIGGSSGGSKEGPSGVSEEGPLGGSRGGASGGSRVGASGGSTDTQLSILAARLKEYNNMREEATFSVTVFACLVCYAEKAGANCVR